MRPRRSLALVSAAAGLALAACGGPPPAVPSDPLPDPSAESSSQGALPDDAKGDTTPKPDEKKAAPAPEGPPRIGAYTHLWTAETTDWNGGLLITRDGDLLSFSSRVIRVHARDDGRVLHQANGCSPVSEDALAFTSDDRFLVVCDTELREYSWPKLGSKKLVGFAQRVDRGSIAGSLVAVAEDGFFAKDKKGKVTTYDARDAKVVDEFVPPGEVETLALAPDGTKLLVGMRDAMLLRDLRSKTNVTLDPKTDGDGAAFSPDSKAIFADFASFEASVMDVATGKLGRTWAVGSWITASRWIDATTIAATGSDGLAIYGAADKAMVSPIGDLGEGIALSKDGGTLCAGGRSGRIACFGKTKPGPTTLAGAFSGVKSPGAPGTDAAAPAGPEVDAKILGRKRDVLEVTVDPATKIEVGSTGTISKPFQTTLPIPISGWMVIAEVKVTKVAAGKVTLAIVATKSAMTMNGRQVDHFAPGPARLALSPPQ